MLRLIILSLLAAVSLYGQVTQQVLPNTSGTVRKAAAAVGVSPVKAEEFVKDTLGGSAPQIINAVDTVAATAGIIPQDEVGGANVLKSVTARFDEARAGEQDQRVYTKLEAVRDKAVNLAIAELQKDPDYKAIADKKQRLEVERKMASRVMSRIQAMTSGHEAWDVSTPEQRIEALEAIDAALGGKSATRRYSPFPMLRK